MKSHEEIPHIGYLFHYPKIDQPGGNFCLEVFLFPEPTGTYFDFVRTSLKVKSELGYVEPMSIRHPWRYEKMAQLCSGIIVMESRDGKKAEAFTLGGRMDIKSTPAFTHCTLVSEAPILNITNADPLHKFFIEELEIVLAQHRVKNPNEDEFDKQLCNLDPFELYLAILNELIYKFEKFPNKDERYLQMLMYLHSQYHRLKSAGLVKSPLPDLGKLLLENLNL